MNDIYTDLQFLTKTLTSWEGIMLDGEDATRQDVIETVGKDFMNFALSILRVNAGTEEFATEKVCRMFRVDPAYEEMNEYAFDLFQMALEHLSFPSKTLRAAVLFDAEFRNDKTVPVMGVLVIDLYERIYDELVGNYEEEDPAYEIYKNFIDLNQSFFDKFSLPEVKKKLEKQNR